MPSTTDDHPENKARDDKLEQFDPLPTELKLQVAEYLCAGDLKSLCLVNRVWSEAVLPILWGTLYSKLLIARSREVRRLTDQGSNITKHLQRIVLTRRDRSCYSWDDYNPMNATSQQPQSALSILLAALQRDQLPGFESITGCSAPELLTMLCLNRLRNLVVDVNSMNKVLDQHRLSERLSDLECLTLIACSTGNNALFNLNTFAKSCSTLEHLEFKSITQEACRTVEFGPQEESGEEAPAPTILKTLTVRMLDVRNVGQFSKYIDVFRIQKIDIHRVKMSLNLLDVLTAAYQGSPSREPHLKIFRLTGFWWHFEDGWHVDSPAQRLNNFLLSFKGLQILHIQGCLETEKLSSSSITHHHETLQELLYVTDDDSDDQNFSNPIAQFDHRDIEVIADSCKGLEHLCLNVHEFGCGRRTDFARQLSQPQPTDLVKAMSSIARLPRLKILRLTNLPAYRKAARLEWRRHGEFHSRWIQGGKIDRVTQKLAAQVLRYLKGAGSGIDLLAISPARSLGSFFDMIPGPGTWPKYYFVPGGKSRKGEEIVTAEFLKDDPMLSPGATILKGFLQPEDRENEAYEDELGENHVGNRGSW